MTNREKRKQIAEETLSILKEGQYKNSKNEIIDIDNMVRKTVKNTKLVTPQDSYQLSQMVKPNGENETIIEVVNTTTLKAVQTLLEEGFENIAALNFASAKNPGGGFLNGSNAQEENLARNTALYESLTSKMEMYEHNRKLNTCLYSDYMIYSPNVVVFRDDNGNLLDKPYQVSIISSPAVNAGVVRTKEPMANKNRINLVMEKRMEKILSLGIIENHDAIVLGAFGCGVFKNNPDFVARTFKKLLLNNPKIKNQYKKVVFAVLDTSQDKSLFNKFKGILG